MPTYDYRCKDCDTEFEQRNSMSEMNNGVCPSCESTNCERFISGCSFTCEGGPSYDMSWDKNLHENAKAIRKDSVAEAQEKARKGAPRY